MWNGGGFERLVTHKIDSFGVQKFLNPPEPLNPPQDRKRRHRERPFGSSALSSKQSGGFGFWVYGLRKCCHFEHRRYVHILCRTDGWNESDFESVFGNLYHRGFLSVADVQDACPCINRSDEFPVKGSDLAHGSDLLSSVLHQQNGFMPVYVRICVLTNKNDDLNADMC